MQDTTWYVDTEGRLDVDKLLAAFQAFFREHSEHWLGRFDYFDRSEGKRWEEKVFRREERMDGRTITVWGM